MESDGEIKDAISNVRISDEYQSQYRPRSNAQGTPEEVENETRDTSRRVNRRKLQQ